MFDPFRRDSHYVPRMYLKPWETTGGQIWTYRILVPHSNVHLWKLFSSKSVAHHLHLYTQIAAGKETDEIERWFDREFERPAQEPIEKVLSNGRLTPTDWKCLVRFLAAQDVRTPASFARKMKRWVESLPSLLRETMDKSLKKYESARMTGQTPATPPPTDDREGPPLRVSVRRDPSGGGEIGAEMLGGRKLWVWTIKRALNKNLNVLHKHHWTILLPPEGTTWFTSDDPVVRLNLSSPTKYDFNGGWNSAGTCIFLPLGPEHLLYTQVGERPPQRGERMIPEHADLVRKFTAEHAWRMVFARERDREVPLFRPRIVNEKEVRLEREQWATWHEQQVLAEQEMNETKDS
ncbi:MAG: DUF4238 domain-containing protein [Pyrinomonadaceae bacterium]